MTDKRLPKIRRSIKKTGRSRCALCRTEAKIANSHIIPEFFYKSMYDGDNTYFGLSQNSKQEDIRFDQGFREDLLCCECEQQFSKYEDYACRVFYGGVEVGCVCQPGGVLLNGIDHRKFRLFLLSMLWRMGVAETAIFSKVELGPFEEELRQMLRAEEPGIPDRFCWRIESVQLLGKKGNWHNPPDVAKVECQRCYRVVIDGFLFLFFVSRQTLPSALQDVCIKRDGTMAIPIRQIGDIPFLKDRALKLGKAMVERGTPWLESKSL